MFQQLPAPNMFVHMFRRQLCNNFETDTYLRILQRIPRLARTRCA